MPTSTSAPPKQALLSGAFVLVLCVQFCFGLSYSCFYLLPKYLEREFHASPDEIGAVAATSLIAAVLATPWMGAWLDRGARRPFATYGALVNAISAASFAFVHSVSIPLFALRAINGISYALLFNVALTLATDLAPPEKLGQAIGLCGAAGMVANAIAPAIAEPMAEHQGWRLVFWLSGAAALVAALLSLAIREPPRAPKPAASASESASTSQSALALSITARRRGAFICGAANGAGLGVMFTFTQPFVLSLGGHRVSSFFIGYTLTALTLRLFLGSLADTWGRRRVAFASLVLYGLVAAMTSFLRPDLLFAVGACLGVAHGLLYPAINALAVEGVPPARRGAVMSYFFASFNIGFSVWVLAAGWIAKAYGYPCVFIATGLVLWIAIPFLPKKLLPHPPVPKPTGSVPA